MNLYKNGIYIKFSIYIIIQNNVITMSVYNVDWDTEINGILLIDDEGITPPRPVFYEELVN